MRFTKDTHPTKTRIFKVSNDTDKYIVIIDNYYQCFDSKESAVQAYDLALRKNENTALHICETPFGCIEMLRPNEVCRQIDFETNETIEVEDKISNYKPINLIGYIEKKWYRWDNDLNQHRNAKDPLSSPLSERLKVHRIDKNMKDIYSMSTSNKDKSPCLFESLLSIDIPRKHHRI